MNLDIEYQKEAFVPDWLKRELDGDDFLARILLQRGINSQKKVKQFLEPEHYKPTAPMSFSGMDRAVDLIINTIKNNKNIGIYGDYDVDGITSTVILVKLIEKIGGEASYHLPDRFKEGYGLNEKIIKEISKDVDLLITCDCGISNYQEVAIAKELGLNVIITDHHHLPDRLPPADIILSPKLLSENHQAYNIPGAGMVYFLSAAVLNELGYDGNVVKEFLDLLSLAIVADVVPLLEENRYLLQTGLPVLSRTKRPGLIELFKINGIDTNNITEEDIAYRIAPMINSTGRIRKADLAAELLLTTDKFKARKLTIEIESINKKRKKLQNTIIDEAQELLNIEQKQMDKPIVLYLPHWHQGVIGIAAGRLCEEYQLPVILMCLKDDKTTITGSARSISDIHIYDELKKCEEYLSKYGGHAKAAGFSLPYDNLTGFKKNISMVLSEKVIKKERRKTVRVDGELTLSEVNMETYDSLRKIAPFGEQNPKPKFISKNIKVIYNRTTTNNRHLRLILGQNGIQQSAIWWWAGEMDLDSRVDIIYTLDINNFQGKKDLQLTIEEIVNKESPVEEFLEKGRGLNFKLIDYRNWQEKDLKPPEFCNAVYFYEGLKKITSKDTINRYHIGNKKTLVLLTCPPALDIFKEIIYAVKPAVVVLAFSREKNTDKSSFLKQLMGIVKYIINNKNGQLDIYQVATLTGQMESTVLVGLKYLETRGMITLNNFNQRYFIVRKSNNQEKRENKLRLKELKNLIKETRSFRQYMNVKEKEKIIDIFS